MRHNGDKSAPRWRGQLAEPGQHQPRLVETHRDPRKNGIPPEQDRDALLEAKDRTIARLKERVASLRRELERKDDVLLRMAESIGELLPASGALAGPQAVTPGGIGEQAKDAQEGRRKPERPTLPDGYRVVATASDAWVLVAPRGLRVAGYRGELDLGQAALDAREHHGASSRA